MSSSQEPSPCRRRFPIVWFAIGFAICNFLTPLVMDATEPTRVTVCIVGPLWGAIVGQLCLLAVWAVFGPLSLLVRLSLTLLLALFLVASVGLGGGVTDRADETFAETVAPFLFLPLILMAAQLPLWCVKLATGGRIIQADANVRQSSTEGRQFGLRHVMGATVVVAVAFSLARSAARLLDPELSETWIPLLFGCLGCILWSTFATLPCLWAGMMAKRKPVAALMIAAYTVLPTLLAWVILRLIPSAVPLDEIVLMFFAFHAALMAVILGTLHVARLRGYTFISRRRRQPIIETACPFAVQDDSCEGTQVSETQVRDTNDPPEPATPLA